MYMQEYKVEEEKDQGEMEPWRGNRGRGNHGEVTGGDGTMER